MRIVKQFQYFPETAEEGRILIILDNEGDLWYTPSITKPVWFCISLPGPFNVVEDDDA